MTKQGDLRLDNLRFTIWLRNRVMSVLIHSIIVPCMAQIYVLYQYLVLQGTLY